MDVNELTIGVLLFWLLMIVLAGLFVGWGWALLAAGMGALVGLEAAIASERARTRLRPRQPQGARCPRCGAPLIDLERQAVCPRCFADLKTNCPGCGAVIGVNAPRCPACGRALPARFR